MNEVSRTQVLGSYYAAIREVGRRDLLAIIPAISSSKNKEKAFEVLLTIRLEYFVFQGGVDSEVLIV